MNRTVKNVTAYTDDLQSALALECSREEAKKMGTLKEWNAINRRIQKLKRKCKRFERDIDKESRTWRETKENLSFAGILAMAIFVALPRILLEFVIVATGVYFITSLFNIPFSPWATVIAWIVIEAVSVVIRIKLEKI